MVNSKKINTVELILSHLGLDQKEIQTYIVLLRLGLSRARTIASQLGLPRTTVQNILIRLEEEQLVTKSIEKNAYLYAATHPENLENILLMKKTKASSKYDEVITELKKNMPDFLGLMKGGKKIPNVRFYQGREAARAVLFDTLTSKTELKDFANIDAMFEHIKDINDEYVAKREKTTITKRSLLLDTPFARKVYEESGYSSKSHTGYKWINRTLYPFAIEMNIYDGKVSYLTYVEDEFIGVIIENEHIYEMHNSIWNLLWDTLPETD